MMSIEINIKNSVHQHAIDWSRSRSHLLRFGRQLVMGVDEAVRLLPRLSDLIILMFQPINKFIKSSTS